MYITSSWKINLHKTSEWQWKKQPFEHVSPIKRGDFSNVIVVFRTEACHPQLPASDIYSNIFTVYRVQLHHFFETDLYNQFVSFLKRNFAFFFSPFTVSGGSLAVHFWVLPTMQTNLQVARFWPLLSDDRGGYPVAFPIWKACFTL